MSVFGDDQRDNHHAFGVVSAFVLNLSLVALPFAAIATWQELKNPANYSYAPTSMTLLRTRHALENSAASLLPDAGDRRSAWSALVQRELDEGDMTAARGLVLSAPAMLPSADAARLEAQLTDRADDRTRIDTALIFLDDGAHKAFDSNAATAAAPGAPKTNFAVLGDRRDLAQQAKQWIDGAPVDEFALALSSLGAALVGPRDAPSLIGASVIMAARGEGKLSPPFAAQVRAQLDAALPMSALKSEVLKINIADPDAVAAAAQRALQAGPLAQLKNELTQIKGVADAVSPSGAALLLSHVDDARDLGRLELVAAAGAERAVVVAKRAPREALLRSARGTLRMNFALWVDFCALGLAGLGVAGALLSTLGQALLREWRHGRSPLEAEDDADGDDRQAL